MCRYCWRRLLVLLWWCLVLVMWLVVMWLLSGCLICLSLVLSVMWGRSCFECEYCIFVVVVGLG